METPPIIIYDEDDIKEGLETCSRSLIGAFLSEKPIHVNSLQNALAGIWCNPKGAQGGRNLRKKIPVSIWGLPLHCRTTKMGTKIGASMGEVRDSEVFEIKEKGSFIKVLINFDTTNPLKAGINVGNRDDGVSWVDFRYEKLPQFCYSCGLVGHEESGCNSLKKQNENQEEPALGPWLRASQFGRRIQSQDYRKTAPSHPGRSKEKQEKLSKDLLDMLSALSVTKKHVAVVENQERQEDIVPSPCKDRERSQRVNVQTEATEIPEGTHHTSGMDPEPQQSKDDTGKENPSLTNLNQITRSPLKCISNTH
ncbi:Zinc knuckle CX2CX4HX4C [Sesbania bispinosa]|nr:Zinc knuckle CX2CX4HX4C [Sesbania bispinosa]